MIKLTDILKERGIFSKEIKSRFAQNQIKLNGEPQIGDIEIDMSHIIEIGDFIFSLVENNIWALRLKLFGLEEIIDSNIKNDLTEHLKQFKIVRTSKKDVFVIKLKQV